MRVVDHRFYHFPSRSTRIIACHRPIQPCGMALGIVSWSANRRKHFLDLLLMLSLHPSLHLGLPDMTIDLLVLSMHLQLGSLKCFVVNNLLLKITQFLLLLFL